MHMSLLSLLLQASDDSGHVFYMDSRKETLPVFTLRAHESALTELTQCRSYDGRLATVAMDAALKIWDTRKGNPNCVLEKSSKTRWAHIALNIIMCWIVYLYNYYIMQYFIARNDFADQNTICSCLPEKVLCICCLGWTDMCSPLPWGQLYSGSREQEMSDNIRPTDVQSRYSVYL